MTNLNVIVLALTNKIVIEIFQFGRDKLGVEREILLANGWAHGEIGWFVLEGQVSI